MQKFFALLFVLFTTVMNAQSGRISGMISDSKTGETLPGATILIEGTTKGASADFDGKFAINNVPAGKVTLVVSYISYNSKKIENVIVKAGDVVDINVLLDASTSKDLTEVEIVVTLNKENNTALVLQQQKSSSVSDGVSAETIKRTPDRNSSDVLKRISGVTIQDDKFVIVRGLNERYNASYLNGSPLPSTESDKRAFAFDLFPANMLDNIVINKTATPDMPSEFAGGIVQVNTKSIPEKNFVSVSLGAGYNTVTTFKDKIKYEGGKLDVLGFDDGSRSIPAAIPSYQNIESWITNDQQAQMAKNFKNDWGYSTGKFAPNANGQFAMGYNFKRKEKDFLGVIFSLSYNNTQNLYTLQRTEYDGLLRKNTIHDEVTREREYFSDVYQTQTATGALLNLACKLNENNSISLKNLFTGAADNRFVDGLGSNTYIDAPEDQVMNRVNSRYFTANRIMSSQLIGDHLLPKSKVKIAWNMGFSNIRRSVPNFRVISYNRFIYTSDDVPRDTTYKAVFAASTGPSYAGYRVYNELNENIVSPKVDVSRLFKVSEKVKIDTKAGGMYQYRDRTFTMRSFGLSPYENAIQGIYVSDSIKRLPEGQLFADQNIGRLGGFKLFENTKADDNYHAASKLWAGYGMAELKYTEKFRAIAGLRYESYNQLLDVAYATHDSIYVNTTVNDLLPSLNLIYNPTEKTGIRLSYYKTLNRPEFRELAQVNWYDPETRLSVAGTPTLSRCYIQNFDARFELYPGRGQLFTTSAFYKYFNSPIERYMANGSESQITYKNANSAEVYGAELEYRVNLGAILKKDSVPFLANLSLFSNLSLIKSVVHIDNINPELPSTRNMQGQAPYIINAGLSYIDNKNWFSGTIMVNRVGSRMYLVGNELILDRWERARTVLDLQVTKSFLKNRLEFRFNVKDLLHPDWIIYYKGSDRAKNGYNKNVDFINFKRNFGSTFALVVSYKF